MNDPRIIIFRSQTDAMAAVVKIGANMGLSGSTFLYAVPRQLVDLRWCIPYPSDPKWLSGVSGYTVAASTAPAAVGETIPGASFVPPSVTNFQARAVLMGMPSPTGIEGRTLFRDVDEALRAEGGVALAAWEYSNDVTRTGPMVVSLGAKLGLTDSQIDQLFMAAAGIVV